MGESQLFKKYKQFYEDGRVTIAGLQKAVKLGFISQEEYELIVNGPLDVTE